MNEQPDGLYTIRTYFIEEGHDEDPKASYAAASKLREAFQLIETGDPKRAIEFMESTEFVDAVNSANATYGSWAKLYRELALLDMHLKECHVNWENVMHPDVDNLLREIRKFRANWLRSEYPPASDTAT